MSTSGFYSHFMIVSVCVCVCARARARVCVCVCVVFRVQSCGQNNGQIVVKWANSGQMHWSGAWLCAESNGQAHGHGAVKRHDMVKGACGQMMLWSNQSVVKLWSNCGQIVVK